MSEQEHDIIGYKKPPRHTRFRPGVSGNPKGRPKRPRNFKEDLAKELARIVMVVENGTRRKLSTQRALIRRLVALGLEGDRVASQSLLSFASELDNIPERVDCGPVIDPATEALIDAEVERRVAEEIAAREGNEHDK
jgi:Family of unknown function (DUF5681)